MKAIERQEATNFCMSILAEFRQKHIDDDVCPKCNSKMGWREEIGCAINRIIHTCDCGFTKTKFY